MEHGDMSGNVYGKLTVVEFSRCNAHYVKYWKCKCACGEEIEARQTELVSGRTKTCRKCKAAAHVRDTTALLGRVFGRLTVKEYAKFCTSGGLWHCQCACGNTTTARKDALVQGKTRSCGCLNKELSKKRSTKHGDNGTPAYSTWRHMRDRCNNPNNESYAYYGGRGIQACPEWESYENFIADIGQPETGHTLDRIDPNGGYNKQNCRWANRATQARNQRPRANQTGYTGVYHTKSGKYVAQIRATPTRICAPARNTLEEAIADRKALEAKYWGERYGAN